MNIKQKLREGTWNRDDYYLLAGKGSLDVEHPGMKILKKISLGVKNILDLGCGEGTRLNFLSSKGVHLTGIDISSKAINIAKKKFPGINFLNADLDNVPLKDESFDLIYSAYVLEHLSNPEKVISKAIRLLSSRGRLVLIAPNYGAPNRSSPCFRGSRLKKLVVGIMKDFLTLFVNMRDLDWQKVEPISIKGGKYHLDWDTTIEPYIGSLIDYFKSKGLSIEHFSSCWSNELPNAKIHQVIFRYLAKIKIFPFYLWGPHLIVVARKK